MTSLIDTFPWFAAGVAFGLLGAALVLLGIGALLRWRPLRFLVRTLTGLLLLAVAAVAGTIAIGIQGYRALAREEVAAVVTVRPTAPQRFEAAFKFPDGREATYDLAGDEIYVDAHILKWKPIANLLGLHTTYELDRVGGRYRALNQERSAPRTVHALRPDRLIDIFTLRQRYEPLSRLLDAEYGSAAFVPVGDSARLELRVSTSGLLIRRLKP
jgi:hypothetical protein